jgi:predicted RNA-binding protein YlxR (DUF448 family)
MKVRKIPMRTCVVTHEQCAKKELIRVVRNNEGVVSVDTTGKAPGRGAYLKLDKEVILKAKKTKALDNKLEVTIPDEIYEELLSLING